MLKRTKIALAASALTLALATPVMAGEGSPDITDNWNNPRTGSMYNNQGWGWQQPGTAYSAPDDDDDDDTIGSAPRGMQDDDDDDDVDDDQ